MNKDNALLILVKAPKLGQVKTRLQPDLNQEDSLLLYRAMVEDQIAYFKNLDFYDFKVVFWPPDSKHEIQEWLGHQLEYLPQRGSDLGERMQTAFTRMFEQDYKKVIIIGSDLPTLCSSVVLKAFANLDSCDLILGPCTDGGYYLIGLKVPYQELFMGIEWGTNIVLQQTLRIAQQNNLSAMQLEPLTDIDTYPDVIQLWCHLNESDQNGKYAHLLKTRQMLNQYFYKKKNQ